MNRLELQLLGSCAAILRPSTPVKLPTHKSFALLTYLAMSAGQPCSRDTLGALFWGDVPDSKARHSLRQALSIIRCALGPVRADTLCAVGESIMLDSAGLRVDATLFERLLERGTPASVQMAVDLYKGDFLEGFSIGESACDIWITTQRVRLRQLAIGGAEAAVRHLMMQGRLREAIQRALRLLAIDPFCESAHRALIRLYADTGQIGAALCQYRECVRLLRTEFQVAPEPETLELVRQIRSHRRTDGVTHAMPVRMQSRWA